MKTRFHRARYFLLCFLLSVNIAHAEEDTKRKHFWYVEPTLSLATINQDFTYIRGWNFAWLYKRKYYLGFESIGMDKPISGTDRRWNTLGPYGGIRFDITTATQISLDVAMATGSISYYYGEDLAPEEFSALVPSFKLIFSINRISEFAINISYLYVFDNTHPSFSNQDLGGPTLGFSFLFGRLR